MTNEQTLGGALDDSPYQVSINGQSVPVYGSRTCAMPWPFRIRTPEEVAEIGPGPIICGTPGNSPYYVAAFPIDGPTTVTITSALPLDTLTVQPASAGVQPHVTGTTLTFSLSKPTKLSIEPKGRYGGLLLFADPPETDIPDANNPQVRYFGPGVHEAGVIELRDNETLYLAPGAVVRGGIHARAARNIRILGRGILCGDAWGWRDGPQKDMIIFEDCESILMEGIMIRCPWQWTIRPIACRGVTIRNVKICGGKNINDDGIDPDSSQDVLIEDCFIRTHDDCISVKGHRENRLNCERITARHCLFWSDLSRVLMVGPESHCNRIGDILIQDSEVLHLGPHPSAAGGWGPAPVFAFQAGEDTVMENIRIENVIVHANAVDRELVLMAPSINRWQRRKTYGNIRDVSFANVHVVGPSCRLGVRIHGVEAAYTVEGVRFENCTVFGEPLDGGYPGLTIGEHTDRIELM